MVIEIDYGLRRRQACIIVQSSKMLARIRRKSLVDICLNVVFGVWVAYFIATGSVIPQPLLRHASHAPVAVVQPADPLPSVPPVTLPDQES